MFPKPKPVFAIVAVVLNPGIPIPLRGYFFMHETVQVNDATRSKARNRKNIFFISHYNPLIDNSRNYWSHFLKIIQLFMSPKPKLAVAMVRNPGISRQFCGTLWAKSAIPGWISSQFTEG